MDEVLSALGRLIGRLIGRNVDCGIDCDASELGWAECLLLLVVFATAFVITRKAINYFKRNDNNQT